MYKIAPKQHNNNSRGNGGLYTQLLYCNIIKEMHIHLSTISEIIITVAHQTKTYNKFDDVPEKFHTRRSLSSSTSAIEKRNDALTSSDGVVGFPIDFDTASSIEGKESQVR